MSELKIGTHLRKIQIRQNRTIQEIATGCKLSKSMISKIGTNKVFPSVSTLVKVAKALGTNVSSLLEENGDLSAVVIPAERAEENLTRTDRGYSMYPFAPEYKHKQMQPFLFLAKKGEVKPHHLTHEGEEAGVDLILLACSTFNQAVELARPMINTPMLQIDRPMMDLAVSKGKRIGLLATVPTTVPASERLLQLAATQAGKKVRIKTVLCSEAFEEIKKGHVGKHNEILIRQIDRLSRSVDVIVMAQVSMSALEPMLKNTSVPVYNRGRTGFNQVRKILESL